MIYNKYCPAVGGLCRRERCVAFIYKYDSKGYNPFISSFEDYLATGRPFCTNYNVTLPKLTEEK